MRYVKFREMLGMLGHVEIGWEDGNEERDQPPARGTTQPAEQQSDAAGDLAHSADGNQKTGRRKARRNDPAVESRVEKMVGSGDYKERGCQRPRNGP
jgi:hypothetical protein